MFGKTDVYTFIWTLHEEYMYQNFTQYLINI
jgi:hypothetical protein